MLSDQTVQEFLDKQTKGMDGPSGALRIALRHQPWQRGDHVACAPCRRLRRAFRHLPLAPRGGARAPLLGQVPAHRQEEARAPQQELG